MGELIDLRTRFAHIREHDTRKRRETPSLQVSTATGMATSDRHPSDPDIGDRVERIRHSLNRINKLMTDMRENQCTQANTSNPRNTCADVVPALDESERNF